MVGENVAAYSREFTVRAWGSQLIFTFLQLKLGMKNPPEEELSDLYEQTLHAGANVRLGEERTGGLHPEDAVQHPEPLLQEVGRVGLQVVRPLTRHDLRSSTTGRQLPAIFRVSM